MYSYVLLIATCTIFIEVGFRNNFVIYLGTSCAYTEGAIKLKKKKRIFGNINRKITSQKFALSINTAVGPSNFAILSDLSKRTQNRYRWKD